MATCEIWLPARYGFRRDLPPGRYGYPRDIASDAIGLPARYACLQDVSYKRIPISSDLTYPAILPVSEI